MSRRIGSWVAGIALAVVGGGVLLVFVLMVGVVGVRSGRDPEAAERDVAPPARPARPAPKTATSQSIAAPDVTLSMSADLRTPPVLDGAVDGDTVVVRGIGFPWHSPGTISWCDTGGCHDRFPVFFDGAGSTLVQYELDVPDGSCRRARECALRIDSDDGSAVAGLFVGVDAPTPPVVRLVDPGPIQPGGSVELEAAGVDLAGVRVLGCPRDAVRREQCRRLVLEDSAVTVPAGTATLVVTDAVSNAPIAAPVAVTLVRVRPQYDAARVIVGASAGLALLAVAWLLIKRTDWQEPAGAAVAWLD